MLQACADGDPFAGAARTLTEQGIPVVVATRKSLTEAATTALVHALYAGLAVGSRVAEILASVQSPSPVENVGASIEVALHADSSDVGSSPSTRRRRRSPLPPCPRRQR
jgi:hypothetical protein